MGGRVSLPFSQFFCELKTVLLKKSIFLKSIYGRFLFFVYTFIFSVFVTVQIRILITFVIKKY